MTAHRSDPDRGRAFFVETMAACSALMQAIVTHPKPVIAEVDGLATAAGLQLVASCDLAIASDRATFCTPGVNIGLFCSTPMVALSRNVSRKQAMEMLLTGETIDAATARDFGLVNRVVPPEYLTQIVTKYAQTIASKSPLTLKIGKEAFYRQAEMSLADAYRHASEVMVENMLARDAEEGIGAFLGKRDPEVDRRIAWSRASRSSRWASAISTAPSPSMRRWGSSAIKRSPTASPSSRWAGSILGAVAARASLPGMRGSNSPPAMAR